MIPILRAAATLVGAAVTLRLTRYEIAERSMLPTLATGDWVLGVRRPRRLTVGDIVVFPHPDRPDLALVKRIAAIAGNAITVLGDAGGVDSRSLGPIDRSAITARLVLRYHPGPPRLLDGGVASAA